MLVDYYYYRRYCVVDVVVDVSMIPIVATVVAACERVVRIVVDVLAVDDVEYD